MGIIKEGAKVKRLEKLCVKLGEKDNVLTADKNISQGRYVYENEIIIIKKVIPEGFKFSLRDIPSGEKIIKYNYIIGRAKRDIKRGRMVHIHNMESGIRHEEKDSREN